MLAFLAISACTIFFVSVRKMRRDAKTYVNKDHVKDIIKKNETGAGFTETKSHGKTRRNCAIIRPSTRIGLLGVCTDRHSSYLRGKHLTWITTRSRALK